MLAAAAEDWYVHQAGYADAGHRLHGTYTERCQGASITIPVYAINNANPALQAWWQAYLQRNADGFDYLFADDTAGTVRDQLYGPGGGMCGGHTCTSTQESPNDAAVVAEHQAFTNALQHSNGTPFKFVFNGFSYDGAQYPNDMSLLGGNMVGGACEGCAITGTINPRGFAPVLNGMAAATNANGLFVLLAYGGSPSGSTSQITQRSVSVALAWLGYSQGHVALWDDLEDNTSNFAVFPEELLYPSNPVQTMRTGATDLQVAPNVWRREFATCYFKGSYIGACAAIINGNSSSVASSSSWFTQKYGHVAQPVGGDVVSGGSVTFGGSVPASVPPQSAEILVP